MVWTSDIQSALVCSRGKEILSSFENYQQTTNADFLALWRPPVPDFGGRLSLALAAAFWMVSSSFGGLLSPHIVETPRILSWNSLIPGAPSMSSSIPSPRCCPEPVWPPGRNLTLGPRGQNFVLTLQSTANWMFCNGLRLNLSQIKCCPFTPLLLSLRHLL